MKLKEKWPTYLNAVIEWKCPHCKEINKSHSKEHHKMDTCKCGKSSIDLEEYCCRIVGDAKILKESKEV